MVYLKKFNLLSFEQEENIIKAEARTCFNNNYPLQLFPKKKLEEIEFDSITIFYGGNGSGKSTILNIIAQKLEATCNMKANKGLFFANYLDSVKYEYGPNKPDLIKLVTSDDVFDYLFDIRNINHRIEKNRNELFEEYMDHKYSKFNKYNDYDSMKKAVEARKKPYHHMSGKD